MLALLLFFPLAAEVVFYCFMLKKRDPQKCLTAKTICSVTFVIIGLVFFLRAEKGLTQWLITVGLVLGALGDIILDIGNFHKDSYKKYFLCGGTSFLLGHFTYIVALFTTLAQKSRTGFTDGIVHFNKWNLDVAMPLFFVLLAIFFILLPLGFAIPYMEAGKSFKIAVGAYLVIVATAAACATTFILCLSFPTFITYSVGFSLFLLSDSTLMTNMFGEGQTFKKDCIIIPSYYLAQFVFSLALYLPTL